MKAIFRLRPWQSSDVPSLAHHLNNKKIWDNCRDCLPYPYTEKDASAFIAYAMQQEEYCIEIDGQAVGNISFIRAKDVERFNAEVGYWLSEDYWGAGIATATLREAIGLYFSRTSVIRLYATVFENNPASMRVLEKVGFQKVGILRKSCFKNGRFIDAHYYELLK